MTEATAPVHCPSAVCARVGQAEVCVAYVVVVFGVCGVGACTVVVLMRCGTQKGGVQDWLSVDNKKDDRANGHMVRARVVCCSMSEGCLQMPSKAWWG